MDGSPTDGFLPNALHPDMADDVIQNALDFVRSHLDMEVAYLSEFVGDTLVFRVVSAPGLEDRIGVGDGMPLDQVYCPYILSGRLPELIPDTTLEPFTQNIALTHALSIRSHVSVPIRRKDGSAYGMFCCMSREPRPTLNTRDLDVMRAFARVSAETVNTTLDQRMQTATARTRLQTVMDDRTFHMVYQPIMDTTTRQPQGFEALCRFQSDPYRAPNLWFEEAHMVGLQTDLEICVIRRALDDLHLVPDGLYMSVNASPDTVASGRLMAVLGAVPAGRVVLELTEHAVVGCYDTLRAALADLRCAGVRLAIDDAGAGYSGLQHIVRLRPDIIKLDISLTARIDTDLVRRSLGTALVGFARTTGATIIAEGVETEAELAALIALEVPLAQGYLLGRPAPLTAETLTPKTKLPKTKLAKTRPAGPSSARITA